MNISTFSSTSRMCQSRTCNCSLPRATKAKTDTGNISTDIYTQKPSKLLKYDSQVSRRILAVLSLAYCPENYSRKNRNAPLTERATIRYHQQYLHKTACRPQKPPLLQPRQSHEEPVLFTQPFHSFDLQQNRANMR